MVLIVDGYLTHKAKKVRAWVDSTQGRFALVYLPAHSSFLNCAGIAASQTPNNLVTTVLV